MIKFLVRNNKGQSNNKHFDQLPVTRQSLNRSGSYDNVRGGQPRIVLNPRSHCRFTVTKLVCV